MSNSLARIARGYDVAPRKRTSSRGAAVWPRLEGWATGLMVLDARRRAPHHEGHDSAIPRRIAPEVLQANVPRNKRAQGMPGAQLAPIASRAKGKKTHELVTTGSPETPSIPC